MHNYVTKQRPTPTPAIRYKNTHQHRKTAKNISFIFFFVSIYQNELSTFFYQTDRQQTKYTWKMEIIITRSSRFIPENNMPWH